MSASKASFALNQGAITNSTQFSSPPRSSRTPISSPIPLRSALTTETKIPTTPTSNTGKGKRKAEEVEGNTPPDVRKQRATFAENPRPHRESGTSGSSHAPSSYTRKRARLSTAATTSAAGLAATMTSLGENEVAGSRSSSRSESQRNQNATNTGTWNSTRSRTTSIMRSHSRASHPSQNMSLARNHSVAASNRAPSRRGSISQASIPISALISPHAPSISHQPASIFHMRDPRKPPKTQPTSWTLAFPQTGYGEHGYISARVASILESGFPSRHRTKDPEDQKEENPASVGWYEGGGSPPHAWLFFLGFIIFPVWWIAIFLKIPRTRSIEGGHDGQKSVVLDDPQVEQDAKSWRKRCRIMSAVSLVTYIPFIILVAIFARR
ncbi:hypothetical protein J3R30DRAFT_2114483 [Lentinula aciculospora]|uniref:Uncharacterized protein n=1 Tax=Lentinula aciculospora TaxID=153920 RepID=A0A9W9DRC6_9AGAR|nr:hypothetical protein J3R30DRAFT_2114483 [Lentinula aciculospora]